jgi:hypothetical protein
MTAILERARVSILEGTFPEAERIASDVDELPTIQARRDKAGELFVVDGQCRTLTALWQGRDRMEVHAWQEHGVRGLPD